jgi:hypothetical protein
MDPDPGGPKKHADPAGPAPDLPTHCTEELRGVQMLQNSVVNPDP